MGTLFDDERQCEACGERFWGSYRSKFCSPACRSRQWRARHLRYSATAFVDACREVVTRADEDSGSVKKLLPSVFRAAAAELRRAGHDPLTLLMTIPNEPATDEDVAPGGIEGKRPERRRWLHPPEVEIEKLRDKVVQRELKGLSAQWHKRRIEKLQKVLEARGTGGG